MIQTLEIPSDKNVYVVGDLHGCYDKLLDKLEEVSFDKENDILISVGDLVDRGEQNLECLSLIEEDWFFAVKGNHEVMMCDTVITKDRNAAVDWLYNGGAWYSLLDIDDETEVNRLIGITNKLPFVIELSYKGKTYIISHAQWLSGEYNFNVEIGCSERFDLTWSRDSICKVLDGDELLHIKGADLFIHGHTPLEDNTPIKSGNSLWIDTGAVSGGELTLIKLGENYDC